MLEAPALAHQILADLSAALEAGEDLRREKRGIGVRLRLLLTTTDPSTGSMARGPADHLDGDWAYRDRRSDSPQRRMPHRR